MSKKQKKDSEFPPKHSGDQSALYAPFVAVVIVYLIGALAPGRLTWGFSYWSLVAVPMMIVSFVVAFLMMVPSAASGIAGLLASPVKTVRKIGSRISKPILVVIISVVVAVVLVYFRSKAHVYGDGFIVLDFAMRDSLDLTNQWHVLFTSLLNHFAYHALSAVTSFSPQQIFGVITSTGGMIGLWAIYRISRQLTGDGITRAFVMLGALSSGCVILMFGYVENYTWGLSLALWVLSFSIGLVKGENGVVVVVVFSVLAFLFHMITLPFAVTALIIGMAQRTPDGVYIGKLRLRYLNLALIVGSFAVGLVMQILKQRMLVPLWPTDVNPYFAFSPGHLVDIFNEVLLVAPLGAALLIFHRFYRPDEREKATTTDGLLGTLSLLTFLAAFWIDPELGAPRDWDLMSFFGFAVTFWGLYRFISVFPGEKVSRRWLPTVAVIALITIVPNLYEKNHPDLAVTHVDALLAGDPHYQISYRKAERCEPWSEILQTSNVDGLRLAIKYLKRRVEAEPEAATALCNLGDSYYGLGVADSAYFYLRKAATLEPDRPQIMVNLSVLTRQMKRYPEAVLWARKAVEIEPENPAILNQLGAVLVHSNRVEEALTHFRKAYQLSPQGMEQNLNLGMCHALIGTLDSAYYYYTVGLSKAPENRKASIYSCLVPLCLDLGKFDQAEYYLNALRRINPGSPDIPALTSRLQRAGRR